MILDTSFLIDLMDHDAEAIACLHSLQRRGEPLLITTPTIFELFTGLARSTKPIQERTKIMNLLQGQMIIPFEQNAAEKAGDIDGTLLKAGSAIGPIDSMIGGIALMRKEKVVTRNVKDFSRITGLGIETY